jgi:hypothetical protein
MADARRARREPIERVELTARGVAAPGAGWWARITPPVRLRAGR